MLLELKNISKNYENGSTQRQVLGDISITIDPGDTLAITGPSGSGKSTLLNIMGTLDKPSSGSVMFNGSGIESLDEQTLANIRNHHFGFVFQRHYLLPQLNLLENVLVPVIPRKDKSLRRLAHNRAMSLLDRVGLSDKLNQLPSQLSVGECQRAAVVRALINEPQLILADEPTGSLDHEAAIQLGNMLSAINKDYKVAIVVVTHSLELADSMNMVYELLDGKLVRKNRKDNK